VVRVVEGSLLLATEGIIYTIRGRDSGDLGNTVADYGAVLDVLATDFSEKTGICAIVRDELRDDCELLGRIHCLVWAVETCIAVAITVEVAAIFIAKAVDAVGAFAASMAVVGARVRCQGCGD
jgi:hypothetical protein